VITCERCSRESLGNRCDHCGHRTVIEQDIEDVRIYLDKAMHLRKENFPDNEKATTKVTFQTDKKKPDITSEDVSDKS